MSSLHFISSVSDLRAPSNPTTNPLCELFIPWSELTSTPFTTNNRRPTHAQLPTREPAPLNLHNPHHPGNHLSEPDPYLNPRPSLRREPRTAPNRATSSGHDHRGPRTSSPKPPPRPRPRPKLSLHEPGPSAPNLHRCDRESTDPEPEPPTTEAPLAAVTVTEPPPRAAVTRHGRAPSPRATGMRLRLPTP